MLYRYSLQNVWEDKDEQLKEEIIDFWLSENAIPERKIAEQRVNQVFFVVRDEDNKIIGVNTAYKAFNKQLNNHLYYYRTFICPKGRKYNMIGEMLFKTMDWLETRFIEKKDIEAVGILLEVENEQIKTRLNQAVWPTAQFYYIGKNQRGDHLRVHYFKDARIS